MDRFWSKVTKTDGCWNWNAGRRSADGYGSIKIDGLVIDAHRQSYVMAYGPIPDGLLVCHKCDNKSCVRPDHLFLGTHKDNHEDAVNKGIILLPDNKHLQKHPSIGSYYRGCRCNECKSINTEYSRQRRSRLKQARLAQR